MHSMQAQYIEKTVLMSHRVFWRRRQFRGDDIVSSVVTDDLCDESPRHHDGVCRKYMDTGGDQSQNS
ncbi:predicted protein [Sclerotinia sclerotiorum 1980 UF-70]|uniref:Uncharacterized protein n=1 Tax=Sclerotinia sclerotiorum (strain ATCC 18683 / 1980 / Ss-1) TaxID=665079 RepID=A7EF15_SCLS1|nr:predicted protein [Sclerotinia sclerotiorum 1980 UF-70]EDO01431.1 predicted protein [Sclerotinia sclerotiorum 1980 UF-70]